MANDHFVLFIVTQAFSVVFELAIDRAEVSEELKQRVAFLIDCITYSVFMYTSRCLFERDKLIFAAQMTFQVYTVLPLFSLMSLAFHISLLTSDRIF